MNYFKIDKRLLDLADSVESNLTEEFKEIDRIRDINQLKVIAAMQENKLSEVHFNPSTGYGYSDRGRDTLDKIFADIFHAEAAFVRQQIVNGTQAIVLCLFACLRPGDELLSITGKPYDTLEEAIGIRNGNNDYGSLNDFNIIYKQVDLLPDGSIDIEEACKSINNNTKVVFLQKSKGYTSRPAFCNADMSFAISRLKAIKNDLIAVVDNCYGEFVEPHEPTEYGADLAAGSLIKNPGGGIATSGGYIAGKAELVNKVAHRFTSPGLGSEVGSNQLGNRLLFQGLFLAPHVVAESTKGAVFCAAIMERLGFEAKPRYNEKRFDIIQSICLNEPDSLVLFCRGIQKAAVVDSFVVPEPWEMPGYESNVIMAAGGFVQGSSIELSADAPLRYPYTVYMQGGLVYIHAKLGVLIALQSMLENRKVSLE